MSNTEYQQLIDFIIQDIVKDASVIISKETKLFDDKFLDSMNILDLIGYIEKKRNAKLTDDEIIMSNFRTVKIIVDNLLDET